MLRDAELVGQKEGLGARIKAAFADAALELFSSRQQGAEQVATIIPIRGELRDPKMQIYQAVLGVLRNAFVEGIADNMAGLPAPNAPPGTGPLEQAHHALSKGSRKPIQASPGPGKAAGEGR